ncbi:HTTM domain-containing protein [Pendulispora albinea]|uniref:HTTM domain-containing protein n=1 Tax=Pendulispora albinea TaxID=2741071 RepID=A0ABZ2LVA3_9BACT
MSGSPSSFFGCHALAAIERVRAGLFRPVDIAFLAAFRFLFGATMCVSMLRFIAYGWIDDFFVKPAFHFKYWGFAWVEPLPADAMHELFWVLAGLGAAMAIGLAFRLAAALFVAGFSYLQLVDVTTYLNHYYLALLLGLLLAVSPAHRAFSVDAVARRALLREAPAGSVCAGWLYLLRFQIGVVYTFAGLAKANSDWLVHAQPLRIWLGSKTGLAIIGPAFAWPGMPLVMSWAGFLFDTFIIWFLMMRRTRLPAFALVIVFHALTRALFPIGMFPVIMVLSALVFFPPDWPRRAIARLGISHGVTASPPSIRAPRPAAWRWMGVALGAAHCAVQLALPLRCLAYGDGVRWHEQGMRFSWRVMVREKNGSITFVVRNKDTGRVWHVSPRSVLTPLQEREMSGQPDLILQFAHYVKRDVERRGGGPVEVHVDALVSLNGREPKRMIDPDIDLASIPDGIGKGAFILPGPTEPPPHIRPI